MTYKIITIDDKKAKICQWAFVLIVIFFSGSAYAASSNSFYGQLKYIIAVGTGAYALWKTNGKVPHVVRGRTMAIWIPCVWSLSYILLWFVHNDTETVVETISRILHIWMVYEIVCIVDWEEFKEKYVQCMLVLAAISLVFYFFLDDTGLYRSLMPKLLGYNSDGKLYEKYQGFLIYFKTSDHRNYGAFWEPGIYATNIIVALLLMPYVRNRKKAWLKYTILIAAVITTASSAGYVLLFLALICNILNKFEINTSGDRIKLVLIIILATLLFYSYMNLEAILNWLGLTDNSIYSKLLSAGESERALSIATNWNAFLESPLIGHGFSGLTNSNAYQEVLSKKLVLDTATSFRLLAAMGVSGILFSMMLIYGIAKQNRLAWYTRIMLCCIALVIVNKEAHDSFMLSWCLIQYLNERETLTI